MTETTEERSGRDRILRALFTLSLAWAILLLSPLLLEEHVFTFNPFPEHHALHGPAEDFLVPLVVVLLAAALAAGIARLAPRFPTTPVSVSSLRMFLTLAVATLLFGAVLLGVLIGVTVAIDPPGPNPENPQYIPLVFWLAPAATAGLTPLGGFLVAWGWVRRKARGGSSPSASTD